MVSIGFDGVISWGLVRMIRVCVVGLLLFYMIDTLRL